MFEPKISVEPNRAPKHRSNKKRVHCCSVVAGISIRSRKKISEKDKKRNEPIRSLISKISVGLGFNCTFKVGDMTLHPNGFTSGAIFFGPAKWLSIKGFPSVSSLNLRKAVKIVFLMSFHPPLLTIQSLLHPGFEPLIFCFSYDNLQPPLSC